MAKRVMPPIHPGEILAEEFMKPLGLSQNALARALGVPPGRIGEIVNGRRAITGDSARSVAGRPRISLAEPRSRSSANTSSSSRTGSFARPG